MQVLCLLKYKGHTNESTVLPQLVVAFCEFQDQRMALRDQCSLSCLWTEKQRVQGGWQRRGGVFVQAYQASYLGDSRS